VRAINGLDNHTAPEAWERPVADSVDLLLSHETYRGRLEGVDATGRRDHYGSERLAEFLGRLAPRWHFFGHHHWYYSPVSKQSRVGSQTQSVGLNQVFVPMDGTPIAPGSFGILRYDGGDPSRSRFDPVEDGWFAKLRWPDVVRFLLPVGELRRGSRTP